MSRKKKGAPISGWLIIDKPSGITSSSVVNRLRFIYGAQKAGHGGTLDPEATGLLPIAFGEATKFIPYLADEYKEYEFELVWGASTTTDDAEGEVIERRDKRPNYEEIIAALPNFEGEIWQRPPAFSAVKIEGKRAYEYARNGEAIELKLRKLWVEKLTLQSETETGAIFSLSCGSGGYVRSIARDLGEELGALAYVKWLRRTKSLGFNIKDAYSYDFAQNNCPKLIEIPQTPHLKHLQIDAFSESALRNGNPIRIDYGSINEKEIVVAYFQEQPLAIAQYCEGELQVLRGLNLSH